MQSFLVSLWSSHAYGSQFYWFTLYALPHSTSLGLPWNQHSSLRETANSLLPSKSDHSLISCYQLCQISIYAHQTLFPECFWLTTRNKQLSHPLHIHFFINMGLMRILLKTELLLPPRDAPHNDLYTVSKLGHIKWFVHSASELCHAIKQMGKCQILKNLQNVVLLVNMPPVIN